MYCLIKIGIGDVNIDSKNRDAMIGIMEEHLNRGSGKGSINRRLY